MIKRVLTPAEHFELIRRYKAGENFFEIYKAMKLDPIDEEALVRRLVTEDLEIREPELQWRAAQATHRLIPSDETNEMRAYWKRTNNASNNTQDGHYSIKHYKKKK